MREGFELKDHSQAYEARRPTEVLISQNSPFHLRPLHSAALYLSYHCYFLFFLYLIIIIIIINPRPICYLIFKGSLFLISTFYVLP
ncbi:hypothetical protein ACB092_05G244000 [Castanea dentata]